MGNLGNITTSSQQIIDCVANVVTSTYGVVGVSSKDIIAEGMNFLANKKDYEKGIILLEDNGNINLEIYFVLAFDFKVEIVLKSLEQNIKNELQKIYQVEIQNIDFYITNVGRV